MFAVALPGYDWAILAALEATDDFARVAQELDPLRAEAVLHAKPPDGGRTKDSWAEAYTDHARWEWIRSRMRLFERQGLTATRDALDLVASQAWRAVTGDTLGQYLDKWWHVDKWWHAAAGVSHPSL